MFSLVAQQEEGAKSSGTGTLRATGGTACKGDLLQRKPSPCQLASATGQVPSAFHSQGRHLSPNGDQPHTRATRSDLSFCASGDPRHVRRKR